MSLEGRTCYRVMFVRDHWIVQLESGAIDSTYVAKQTAVAAARSMARAHWILYGASSYVEIELPDGSITKDYAFGV